MSRSASLADFTTDTHASEPDPLGVHARAVRNPGMQIERQVPFSDLIVETIPGSLPVAHLQAGLAATFSTAIDNPFFKLPTAQDERNGAIPAAFAMYGPYYVGTDLTPEQIAVDVAARAALYLRYLDDMHGHQGYVGRLMSVLRSGRVMHNGLQAVEDRNILFDVDDFLAGITHRLRHVAPVVFLGGKPCSAAEAYRDETHALVDPYVRTVDYDAEGDALRERFVLPHVVRSDPNKTVALGWDFFTAWEMRRAAEFAALAAERVGNPLVRGSLRERYIPAHVRMREYMRASR
jgi:hypothetical protein